MIASVGLVRYAKCVLFGASTPRPEPDSGKVDFSAAAAAEVSVPADFRCPISLELMKDPVVVASGQTYDRESISHWIASGHATCPKTGQALAHQNLVPNKALKNLISLWCREENIPFDVTESEPNAVTANKAATEAARMTASFLVETLAASKETDAANRIVHELRQLATSGSDVRSFIGGAGGIPLLVPLLSSSEPNLQLNAVTALLNLSVLEANKKRIMHADGAIDGIVCVLSSGATWRARENAAAAVVSLSGVHSYRRRLGRDRRIVAELVNLVNVGPISTRKYSLDALASLAGDRENIRRLVESGVIKVALEAVEDADSADEAVAVLAALAKRGGAPELGVQEGVVRKLVRVLKNGSDSGRANAASALVYLCRKAGGGNLVAELAVVPGVEWVIWEMMASGTERGRRKAAALGRICRRWAVAAEADRLAARYSDVSLTVASSTRMAVAQ
ncbi:putative U-box domain-containing protein 16 [Iris pallida]|uniref:RING-type E3 ubiquitin transferase n=1 Tax=Iris pallida TaxID=29817 RepID=A0AAX6EKR6_IRIPA|nr:putative U-box domain-containing protein 16 [Iris pallida]